MIYLPCLSVDLMLLCWSDESREIKHMIYAWRLRSSELGWMGSFWNCLNCALLVALEIS